MRITHTGAITIKCDACAAPAGVRCVGGVLHQVRIDAAASVTREANRIARENKTGTIVGETALGDMSKLSHADHLMVLKICRPWCYWVFPGWWSIDHGGRYIVSVVVDREAGHYPTGAAGQSLILTKAEAPDLEGACLEARFLNRDRGLADRETDRIVASSLGSDVGRGDRFL